MRPGLATPSIVYPLIAVHEITPAPTVIDTNAAASTNPATPQNQTAIEITSIARPATQTALGTMGDFLLNPYDATLDLKNKEDRKLFQDACRGLKEKDLFGGGRDKYTDFVKLIEREFNSTRVMEALQIATKWNTDAPTPDGKRAVAQDGIVNAFTTNKITRNEVVDHYNRVWGNVPFTDPTRKEFQHFEVAPTNDAELKEFRNRRRLKHVMMGQMLWNSLTSAFQINEFQRRQEHDSPLLWDYIRRRVKPSTTVGASKLKDDIEGKTLKDFDNDVTRYNSWLTDTRDQIIREEGDGYNEYMRSLFSA